MGKEVLSIKTEVLRWSARGSLKHSPGVPTIGSGNIRKLERRGVSGREFIVGEHAAQAASAQDRSLSVFEAGRRKNEHVAAALMISLGMAIRDELPHHVPEQALSTQECPEFR